MTLDEIKTWLLSRGYQQDRFGHFQKTITYDNGKSKTFRYKIQDRSIRKEHQITYDDGKHDWVRIASGYLSKLSLNDKNQLEGMK